MTFLILENAIHRTCFRVYISTGYVLSVNATSAINEWLIYYNIVTEEVGHAHEYYLLYSDFRTFPCASRGLIVIGCLYKKYEEFPGVTHVRLLYTDK